jgi:hypothetical protein
MRCSIFASMRLTDGCDMPSRSAAAVAELLKTVAQKTSSSQKNSISSMGILFAFEKQIFL